MLSRLEAYYDAVPRAAARVESWPPFTLFARQGDGWPYYARPALGSGAVQFTAADVQRVRERQRALGVPEAFEWVGETTPGLRAAVEAAGLPVRAHPLLVLALRERQRTPEVEGAVAALVAPDDPDLALYGAVPRIGFDSPGTAIGAAGAVELRRAAAEQSAASLAFHRERLRSGRTVMAVARLDGLPVSAGSHQPVDGVTEIVGVATLPQYRRRGLAALVVDRLIEDALAQGVDTIFLSADDDAVARVYARLGFRLVGTAYTAEPAV